MERKYLILFLLIILAFSLPVNAQVFDLSSTKNSSLSTKYDYPCVYKPSKLVLGTSTKFVIKAEPKSHVSLVTSEGNGGYPEIYGHKLRLGQTINPHEDIVRDNGIIEIEISLPLEKDLVGKMLFFEVLVWKNSDFSDLKVAKIMGINGNETGINAVLICEPPKNTSLPGLGTTIPGTSININRAMDFINKDNISDDDSSNSIYQDQMNYSNEPLMIRNLRVPELKNNQ